MPDWVQPSLFEAFEEPEKPQPAEAGVPDVSGPHAGIPFSSTQVGLVIALSAAVPLNIMEMKLVGGITNSDVEFAHGFAHTLGEKGDILQYRGKKKGETASIFNGLARALAILSFAPGGVTFCGEYWESLQH